VNTPQLLTGWRKSSHSGGSGGNCVQIAVAEVAKESAE
jgi:hypothetical protein